ncbi:hypothetical protein [Klebsiella aerogenes]|uniref:hypothetical protein n=1 Tax=Klebsiella aerogenes TaxID=548 RepID=UPI00351D0272
MHKLAFALTLLFITTPVLASGAPLLGDVPADAHQLCGKDIDVQIKKWDGGGQIIGLMNKESHEINLFQATTLQSPEGQYLKFMPTKYDELSKRFVIQNDDTIDILWGGTENENHQMVYSLSLGSHVYDCGLIQKWPNETADKLYGEEE